MEKPVSPLNRGRAFLKQKLAEKTWQTGDKLPPILQLSTEAGISSGTMRLAIHELCDSGILTVRRNWGVFLGTPQPQSPQMGPSGKTHHLADKIASLISSDSVEGRYMEDDFLPSCKELCNIYGVSFAILKKALSVLLKNGRVVPYKKRFKIVRQRSMSSFRSLVLVQGPNFINLLDESYFRTWFYVFMHHLEKECSRRNLTLNRSTYTTRFTDTPGFESAQGFIIYLDRSLEQKAHDIALFLLQYQKPIIFFNEGYLSIKLPPSALVHECRIPNYRAGFQIGNFILESGYKKACFLGRYRDEIWSKQRLEGVRDAFLAHGMDFSAVVVYENDLTTSDKHSIKISEADRKAEVLLDNEAKNLQKIDQLSKKLLTDDYTRTVIFNRNLGTLYTLGLRFGLSGLFSKANSVIDAKVWIADDDNLAVFGAIEYCKRNRIRVPQDISIVSFNNQIEAFTNNLTSYDFNMPGIIGRMMDIIFWPQKKNSGKQNMVVEVEGFIAVRRSTK